MPSDLALRVAELLDVDPADFHAQARSDAEVIRRELRNGAFDNNQSVIGLEYEFYAVGDVRWRGGGHAGNELVRVPRRLLEFIRFEKELGLHNAELTVSPKPLNAEGLRAQAAGVRSSVLSALQTTHTEGMQLVSDGMWTIPPAGETAERYLTDSTNDRGLLLATNMTADERYHAMANGPNAPRPFTIDTPHVSFEADTVMPGSLTTSIQPHYQIGHAHDLPGYHNYALRVAGPLLALAVNSPFFPPDLYDDGSVPAAVVADANAENRIPVFESVANAGSAEKVRFPRDLQSAEEAVDRIADDPAIIPIPVERGLQFDDRFATFAAKHGSFWRWIRPVFGGNDRTAANVRVEFRPLPAQPTIRDSMAFVAAFAGLMESLPRRAHPVIQQDWATAQRNFYAAVNDGLASHQQWITSDGVTTTDPEVLYDELLGHAVDGLRNAGCTAREAAAHVAPLRSRFASGVTPAEWKRTAVRTRLAAGDSLDAAIYAMQRAYISSQAETLVDGSFADWPEPSAAVTRAV